MAASDNNGQMLLWIATELCQRYGNLTSAFQQVDDNKSEIITVTKLTRALSGFGIDRQTAEALFKRLVELASCEMKGALELRDWLAAFSCLRRGEEQRSPGNPLLASLDSMLGLGASLLEDPSSTAGRSAGAAVPKPP
jgi:hypothetical protein